MPAAKKKTAKDKTKRKVVKKVWHIYHFAERYELPDDVRYCRKSPLLFTRDFVGTGQDDEAISYQQQMMALHHKKTNGFMLKGIFADLKNIAANRSRAYRGYMLDEKLHPANEKKISQWLRLDEKLTATVLKELADVGLIERVPLPEFDLTVNDKPGGDDSGHPRNPPESSGNPLKKEKEKGKGKSESGSGKGNRKRKALSGKKPKNQTKTKTESETEGERKNIPSTTQTPAINAQTGMEPQDQTKPKVQLKVQPKGKPKELPKENPTNSDEGEGMSNQYANSPPHSFSDNTEVPTFDELYDSSGQEFASTIFRELRTFELFTPDSIEGRQELGAFASAWYQARRMKLKPSQLTELWNRSVESARTLAKKPRKRFTKSSEAVWQFQFKRRLAVIKSEPAAGFG